MMPNPTIRFASYDLDMSIAVARALDANGGSASADELATRLGYKSKNNGAFLARLASARAFGLVDGQSDKLSPSALAIRILRPDYPETAAKARLEAFETVPLNKAVLDTYHGQVLPDNQGLSNALRVKWAIDSSKAAQLVARLLDSAEQAGLFTAAGNRTKMIRPTIGKGVPERPQDEPDPGHGSEDGAVRRQEQPDRPASPRNNKLIDGVLDELPPIGEQWSEAGLQQWLEFLESALRVVYRLPKGQGVTAADGRDGGGR